MEGVPCEIPDKFSQVECKAAPPNPVCICIATRLLLRTSPLLQPHPTMALKFRTKGIFGNRICTDSFCTPALEQLKLSPQSLYHPAIFVCRDIVHMLRCHKNSSIEPQTIGPNSPPKKQFSPICLEPPLQ